MGPAAAVKALTYINNASTGLGILIKWRLTARKEHAHSGSTNEEMANLPHEAKPETKSFPTKGQV